MARPPNQNPTDGELEVLNILWESGPSELGKICAAIRRNRPVATTTIATVLGVMLEKGFVKRTDGLRGYLWSARLSQRATAKRVLRRLVDRMFEGSAQSLVAHLMESVDLSEKDRQEIRRLLDEEGGPDVR